MSPRCCGRESGRAGWSFAALSAASSAPSALIGPRSRSCCAPTVTTRHRKCSTGAGRTGRLDFRPRLQRGALPPCRGAGDKHGRALQGSTEPRQGAPLHAVLRRRPELAPGRAHHRPPRGRARGNRSRFIVTSLEGGRAKNRYERLYCARGQAENHIKAWKNHLAADRTPCQRPRPTSFVCSYTSAPIETPPHWWTPLLSSDGRGKVSNGPGAASIHR